MSLSGIEAPFRQNSVVREAVYRREESLSRAAGGHGSETSYHHSKISRSWKTGQADRASVGSPPVIGYAELNIL